ncbi:hypothetical protein FEM48_Zijuj02G0120500 [Ziziphus jujuba var. spinosa]|uniref:ATP-dependent DNA helicase n=1 Tax=Ziziphus jujuba var. spinosa TaxID=714518 RepID=A0A978VVL9_ZIZJJ|nr:hypothetical protein FEM48_Zijuj02G0120500 [Ziziphus jujuba var. spinosa]
MESLLKQYFGYSAFRPYQKEVIEKIINKRDCLVVMATGSGKSLCYQIPPLAVGTTGIVVSPLISLMQDQVMSLKQRGIKAEFLGSTQTDQSVYTKAQSGEFHILFMTPEKACMVSKSFWSNLLKVGICLFAVDEAHCISEWGHSFRVRNDIISSLKMKDPYVAIGSFDRQNLFYGVKSFNRGQSSVDELVQEISKFVASTSSTIVYCTTRNDVEQIYKSLQEAGIKAAIYHGQMGNKAREESHRLFITDELHVMVATIAFGMGIDKPNVRQVIHYGCPKSLESYYQESGRCGRDGMASVCWLYYTRSDFAKADFYIGELQTENQRKAVVESLMAAQHYCLLTTCRRKFLLNHFGENLSAAKCENCDNCIISRRERDMSREAFLLMACIQSCKGRWGLNMPVDILRGSRSKKVLDAHSDKLPLYGLGKGYSSNWWKALAYTLISSGYLMETVVDIYKTVSVSPKGVQYLSSATPDYQPPLVLPVTNEMVAEEGNISQSSEAGELKKLSTLESEGFSEAEEQLYHMLLEERMKLARGVGTAPYAICGDQTIKKIALTRPSTKARLANIDGVNQTMTSSGSPFVLNLMLTIKYLLMTHGNHVLQTIEHLSRQLNLSLDGEASIQTATTRKVYPVPSQHRKLTQAKFVAWQMWHEDGLSVQKIANNPARPSPIKEQTVTEYLLEAAQEGFAMDWTRFCAEVGLTLEMFSDIKGAILKVGSTEKLKPIKNELSEDINYTHIKTCLAMHNCGITPEVVLSGSKASGLPKSSLNACCKETPCEVKTTNQNLVPCLEENEETASLPFNEFQEAELPLIHDTDLLPKKRQKVSEPEKRGTMELNATEDSILDWLKNYEGVTLSDIVKHFSGSEEQFVSDLVNQLEGEFFIYKKNNVYKLM